ncbi:MAG: TIGR03088 family PEP-CTERM/XrtA system glycosyltransferase [Pseudomonadota bacterium]
MSVDARPLVAHVIHRLGTGGMENGLVNLVNGLPGEHYRHAIVCMTESTPFRDRIEDASIGVHELHKQSGKDLGCYWRFFRLMRRLRPAIVHTRNLGTIDLAPVAALAGVPRRLHGEHGWDNADPTGANPRYRRLRRLCDRFIDGYVAVSRDIARWMSERIGVDASRVMQIYNGVDSARFAPDGPRTALPATAGDAPSRVIGTVGRLDPIKRFDVLIDWFATRYASQGDARLVIVGEGAERSALEQQVAERGIADAVWLAGNRPDVADLMRSMDVFVLPSRNEGISNTILEAMASGLPVVATDVGGNCELIDPGVTGELVPCDDSPALGDAIAGYLDDPDRRLRHGTAARERVLRRFSLENMMGSYDELYMAGLPVGRSRQWEA